MEKLELRINTQQESLDNNKQFDNYQYKSPRNYNQLNGRNEGIPNYQVYAFYTSCSLRIYFMMEELNIPYQDCPVNIRLGEHYKGEFNEITPNNKIPMLVDNTLINEKGDIEPLRIFESGAILIYLAEKYPESKLLPTFIKPRERSEVIQWLIWNVSEMGPTITQYVYYFFYAQEANQFGMNKADKQVHEILKVLNKRLEGREFLCNNQFSIADIALFGWGCFLYFGLIPELDQYQNITIWINKMIQRPTFKKYLPIVENSLRIRKLKRLDNNEYLIK